jgi:hypothetical protein
MHEISYETYCKFGGCLNSQLCKKDLYAANGRFVKVRYYAYDGPLYYKQDKKTL